MPVGVYKHIPHSGSFKKGHKDLVPAVSRKKQAEKMKKYFGANSWMTGRKQSGELIEKRTKNIRAEKHYLFGKHQSEETKRKISLTKTGRKEPPEVVAKKTGVNSHRYIRDRTKLKKADDRRKCSTIYNDWRKQVWIRDDFICRLKNKDCKGRIEAHHIYRWANYPELRFVVSNGITLCHLHHPRVKAEEQRLIPIFKELLVKRKA